LATDRILRKNFWLVTGGLVAVAVLFAARAVSYGIALFLAPPLQIRSVLPPSVASGASTHAQSAEAILSRNPFDHVTGALREVPTADVAAQAGPDLSKDPMLAPACDGVKVLVITASSDPEWSFAAMTANGDAKSQLRRRGQDIGGKRVEYISWDRVWLASGPSLCQAELFRSGDTPKTAPAPIMPTPMPGGGGSGAPQIDPAIAKGIARVSATEFNIDRGTVDKILENQADLMRTARIVPEKDGDGKVVGIRLFGVKPETLLGTLGMENGDRLQTINGFDMASPEKALEAYARLRTAEKLTVQVNRRGQNVNLDFNIK
jgi:general secretion pathway protein C